jgi:hypothetical protein
MKAALARSESRSTERDISRFSVFISQLRDRIQSFSKVLIAELLCATSCEVA